MFFLLKKQLHRKQVYYVFFYLKNMYKAKYIEKDNQLYLQLTSKKGKKQLLPITEERATLLINDEGELKRDIELSEALNDPRFFPAPVEGNEIEELLDRYLANKNKADNWSNILKEMNLTPLKQIFKTDRDKIIDDILNDPKARDEEKIRIKKAIEIMNNLGIGADGDDKVKDLEENMENSLKKIEKLTTRLNQYEDKTIAEVVEEEDDKVIKNLYKLTNTINKKVDGNTKIIDILQIANNTANELKDIIGISDDDDDDDETEKEANTKDERLENMEKQIEYIKNLLEKPKQKQTYIWSPTNSSIKREEYNKEKINKSINSNDTTEIEKEQDTDIKVPEMKYENEKFLKLFNEPVLNENDKSIKGMINRRTNKDPEAVFFDKKVQIIRKKINDALGLKKNSELLSANDIRYFGFFEDENKDSPGWDNLKEEYKKMFTSQNQYNKKRQNFIKGTLKLMDVLNDEKPIIRSTVLKTKPSISALSLINEADKTDVLNTESLNNTFDEADVVERSGDEITPSPSVDSHLGKGLKRLLAKYTRV